MAPSGRSESHAPNTSVCTLHYTPRTDEEGDGYVDGVGDAEQGGERAELGLHEAEHRVLVRVGLVEDAHALPEEVVEGVQRAAGLAVEEARGDEEEEVLRVDKRAQGQGQHRPALVC